MGRLNARLPLRLGSVVTASGAPVTQLAIDLVYEPTTGEVTDTYSFPEAPELGVQDLGLSSGDEDLIRGWAATVEMNDPQSGMRTWAIGDGTAGYYGSLIHFRLHAEDLRLWLDYTMQLAFIGQTTPNHHMYADPPATIRADVISYLQALLSTTRAALGLTAQLYGTDPDLYLPT